VKRFEVEAWAHSVIRELLEGHAVEDQHVEAKRDWPVEFTKAARRVAGHANSAGFEPIMWLIGVDEKAKTILGASSVDAAAWYAQLKAEFVDGWAPPMRPYNVPHERGTVTALVFDTEAAPFVVKAPQDRHEIPWRDSTGVRSARRSELFALLAEPVRLPEFEILHSELRCSWEEDSSILAWQINAGLYITPRTDKPVFFPKHRMRAWVQTSDGAHLFDLSSIYPHVEGEGDFRTALKYRQIETDIAQLTVAGPGHVEMFGRGETRDVQVSMDAELEVRILLQPAGSAAAAVLMAPLSPRRPESSKALHWAYPALSSG
jgi:hypothetical protein